jgi:predicted RNase H-like HicB family nuclease
MANRSGATVACFAIMSRRTLGREGKLAVKKVKRFTVPDGEMVLTLEPAEEGGYLVTSPFDPHLITESETIEEAFEMARDAAEGLRKARANLFGRRRKTSAKGA